MQPKRKHPLFNCCSRWKCFIPIVISFSLFVPIVFTGQCIYFAGCKPIFYNNRSPLLFNSIPSGVFAVNPLTSVKALGLPIGF
ncbi:hypothetical protein CS542_08340 [Pedobacter sp. IW39]|nr:hypothetical protein CS542_08340 [Pedobacter sp. IW39]